MDRYRYLVSACVLGTAAFVCGPIASAQNTTNASSSDKKFVESALKGGNAEVKLGQLAAEKGNSEDVKQFGQKMVDDHTKLGEQMKQIAQQEGFKVPEGIPAKDKALESKLNSLSGDAFDRAYMKAMLKDHEKDLSDFKQEANSGNDTSIKDAASHGAQVISEHLQLAEQIAQKHGIEAGNSSKIGKSKTGTSPEIDHPGQSVGNPGQPQL
jgi:putative membrane protein